MTGHTTPTASLPGPPVSRWRGPFPDLRRDALGFLLHCQSYGDVVKLPMGLLAALFLRNSDAALYLLNHPADVKHVLVTNQDNYSKAMVPPVESRIFGHGLLHTEGETHHHQRRLLLPFFHSHHVASYAELITANTQTLIASWHDGMRVDIGQHMAQLTVSVIWRLLFGEQIGPEAHTIRDTVAVGQRLIKLQYDSLLASLTPLWVPTTLHRRFTQGIHSMDAMILQMIDKRRLASRQYDDVLSLLLNAKDEQGHPLSDQNIRDELMTLLLAGHETTANALIWTCFLLSQFRSVRERLGRELHEVLGHRFPTAADLPHLTYTKMIWDEALRLYPPAWALHTRASQSQDRLPSGAVLPPNAWVMISPWSLHHNPRWFPDPNRFDPERFSEEARQTHLPFSYLPFGAGGRRCLGESFAEQEGLLILATLASRIQLRLVDGQPIQPVTGMTLHPNIPVQMIVQQVSSQKSFHTVTQFDSSES